jgi:hypothetical protein
LLDEVDGEPGLARPRAAHQGDVGRPLAVHQPIDGLPVGQVRAGVAQPQGHRPGRPPHTWGVRLIVRGFLLAVIGQSGAFGEVEDEALIHPAAVLPLRSQQEDASMPMAAHLFLDVLDGRTMEAGLLHDHRDPQREVVAA